MALAILIGFALIFGWRAFRVTLGCMILLATWTLMYPDEAQRVSGSIDSLLASPVRR